MAKERFTVMLSEKQRDALGVAAKSYDVTEGAVIRALVASMLGKEGCDVLRVNCPLSRFHEVLAAFAEV